MKYENKKNGKLATLVEQNDKFKTVLLEYEDGSTQSITTSTFKRWWKKLNEEDAYVAEVMQQKKDLGIEVPAIDVDEIEVVSEEPVKRKRRSLNASDSKEARRRTRKEEREKLRVEKLAIFNKRIQDIVAFGNEDIEIRRYERSPRKVIIAVMGRAGLAVYANHKGCTIHTKEYYVPKGIDFMTMQHAYLPATFKVQADKELEVIKKIIETIISSKKEAK